MTEYELYQLLEDNGYEPSEENLDILCEGVENGSILILNEKDRLTKEYERAKDPSKRLRLYNAGIQYGAGIQNSFKNDPNDSFQVELKNNALKFRKKFKIKNEKLENNMRNPLGIKGADGKFRLRT